jgi:hypothetical protein
MDPTGVMCLASTFNTSTKITALAEVSSAQLSAQKYLSMMPMCLAMCPAQWIQ